MAFDWFRELLDRIDRLERLLLRLLWRCGEPTAVSIALALPRVSAKDGTPIPNFELQNDKVYTVAILTQDSAGQTVPAPSGDTFTAVASDTTSLQVAVTGGSLVLTPLVQGASNVTVTVSDADGLTADVQIFDIVSDLTPTNIVLDLADATTTPQPVPGGAPQAQAKPNTL